MNTTTKFIVVVVIVLIALALIGAFIAEEGSMVIFLIRLVGGLTFITLFMSVIMGGMPQLLNERCPKCKNLNTFVKVEEILDDKDHKLYRRCKSCGYTKPTK